MVRGRRYSTAAADSAHQLSDGICTEIGPEHDTMEELLRDADVIDHSLSDPSKEVKLKELERYTKICAELGLAD